MVILIKMKCCIIYIATYNDLCFMSERYHETYVRTKCIGCESYKKISTNKTWLTLFANKQRCHKKVNNELSIQVILMYLKIEIVSPIHDPYLICFD